MAIWPRRVISHRAGTFERLQVVRSVLTGASVCVQGLCMQPGGAADPHVKRLDVNNTKLYLQIAKQLKSLQASAETIMAATEAPLSKRGRTA